MNKTNKIVLFAFVWHGFFLALTMAMLDLNTVFPTLVSSLSENKVIFGSMLAIMLGTPLIFNMLFSHYLRRAIRKKKYLLFGIYLRSLSFLGMAIFTYYFASDRAFIVILSFYFFLLTFSISAGFAGISYSDLVAKTIPASNARTSMYSIKQFVSSIAGFGGGLLITYLFKDNLSYPLNYAISLFIGFVGLMISTIGFWFVKEPDSVITINETESLLQFVRKIPSTLKKDKEFRMFILVENLSSFGMMIMPFYMIYAKEVLAFDSAYIGIFLLIQISGTVLSNLFWGLIGKKLNSSRIVLFCIILGSLNPLLAIFLSLFQPSLFGIVFFFVGFTISGRKIGFEPYLLDIAPTNQRIEYLGIRGSLNILVIILPLISALLIKYLGYYFTFITVSIVMMLAAYILSKTKNNQYIDELCQKS